MAIRAVLLDWGGVMIEDPAPGLVAHCSRVLGVSPEAFQDAFGELEAPFQRGEISEQRFWRLICNTLGVGLPGFPSLWGDAFAAAYRPVPEMFQLAASLRHQGYKTALLSNTELPAVEVFHQQGHDEAFDELVFSCVEGTRKPEPRIYRLAANRLGVEIGEVLFFDDRQDYVDGALRQGMQAELFSGAEAVRQALPGWMEGASPA